MRVNTLIKGIDKFENAAEHAAPQTVLCPIPKKSFDHIEPGRACGRVVNVKAAELLELPCDLRVLVRRVVVDKLMEFPAGRCCDIDEKQERNPFLVPMTLLAQADDLAACRVDCRKQGGRAMPFMIVGHCAGPARLHRQARLRPVEGLHLARLIYAKHSRLFRGSKVKPTSQPPWLATGNRG